MSARVIVVIGAAVSMSVRLMREPVTWMRSSVVVLESLLDVWAKAAPMPEADTVPTASAKEIASRSFVVLQFIDLSLP